MAGCNMPSRTKRKVKGGYLEILPSSTNFDEYDSGVGKSGEWKKWKVGRPTIYEYHSFDGSGRYYGTITSIQNDGKRVMEIDDMKLIIDDWSASMFA